MTTAPQLFQAAALRHRQLRRSPGYLGGPAALDFHVGKLVAAQQEGGTTRVRLDGDEVSAMVAWMPGSYFPGTAPIVNVVAHQATGAPSAADWLAEQVDEVGLPDNAIVRLCPWDRDLRAVFEARGLSVCSVALQGRIHAAYAGLLKEPKTRRQPSELIPGARLRGLLPWDVDAVVDLVAEVFAEQPQYCPFGTEAAYHERLRTRHRGSEKSVRFVVEVDGRIRGLLCGWVREPDVHTPPASLAMDLIVGKELQGKGLSWVAYRRLVEGGIPLGAEWIKGTTGQPGVMKVARAMGRWTVGVDLDRGTGFPPGWFDEALTDEAIGSLED